MGITKENSVQLAGINFSRAFLRWLFVLGNAALVSMELYIGVTSAPYGITVLLVVVAFYNRICVGAFHIDQFAMEN